MGNAPKPSKLVAQFRRLGVPNPESWAHSQEQEGIPQLARARLLYLLWTLVRSPRDTDWIDRDIERYYVVESHGPGRGRLEYPHVPVLTQAMQAGISKQQLTRLARQSQVELLRDLCMLFDGGGDRPAAVGTSQFGIFELDEAGNPLHRVDALHENFHDFDRDLATRRKAKNRNPSDA
jgi:hypothetical protein